MPKRKTADTSEEESFPTEHHEDSGSDSGPSSSSKKKGRKKEDVSLSKKSKVNPNESSSVNAHHDQVKIQTNAEGDKFIDLGKKRRAVVRSFKGVALLDIREYYDAGGEEKPGKKGISLTLDQWKLLKEGSETIDELFSQQTKK